MHDRKVVLLKWVIRVVVALVIFFTVSLSIKWIVALSKQQENNTEETQSNTSALEGQNERITELEDVTPVPSATTTATITSASRHHSRLKPRVKSFWERLFNP